MPKREQTTKPVVLIIEDEQFLCSLMEKKLTSFGMEVQVALDGEVGLKKIEEHPPDVILLDLLLPGIDGFEVLKRLKREERFRDIPVLVISNLGEARDVRAAMKAGATDYIVKAESSPEQIAVKARKLIEDAK